MALKWRFLAATVILKEPNTVRSRPKKDQPSVSAIHSSLERTAQSVRRARSGMMRASARREVCAWRMAAMKTAMAMECACRLVVELSANAMMALRMMDWTHVQGAKILL